jgi:hypothetical protein
MLRTVLAHLRAQWMGALALFLVLAGGTAYAANTVFSADIVDGEVKAADLANNSVRGTKIANGQVQSADVNDGSLSGVDIADQSGVDTCPSSVRLGDLCVRAENFARKWEEALHHCGNLGMRVPTIGEAIQLAQLYDIPNVDEGESFWTDEYDRDEVGQSRIFTLIDQANSPPAVADRFTGMAETLCVTSPTN